MGWADIPDTEKKRLLDLKASGSLDLETLSSICAEYNIPLQTVQRRLREQALNESLTVAQSLSNEFNSIEFPQRVYNDYIVLREQNAMICSDWEFPDVDMAFLLDMLLMAIRYNIRTLIIVGDVHSGDVPGLSTWPDLLAESNKMNLSDELHLLSQIIRTLLKWFTKIIFVTGNHDERMQKATGGQFNLGMYLKLINENIEYSVYRYMYLTTKRKTYTLTHPRNYSMNSLGLGQKLSNVDPGPDRDGTRVGVILGHTHHGSLGTTLDGSAEVIGLGCMRDPEKTKYKSVSSGTNPQWNRMFVMLRQSYLHTIWKEHTDINFYLGEHSKFRYKGRYTQ